MDFNQAIIEFNKIQIGINNMPFLSYAAIIKNGVIKNDYKIEIGLTIRDGFGITGYQPDKINIFKINEEKRTLKLLDQFSTSYKKLNEDRFIPRLSYGIKQLNDNGNITKNLCTDENLDSSRHDSLKGGISISSKYIYNHSGTLGAIIKLKNDSSKYAITNHHVIHNPYSNTRIVTQPSVYDAYCMCPEERNIGLTAFKTYTKYDFALIRINDSINIGKGDRNNKPFGKLAKPQTGSLVSKCGRTSGESSGKILSKHCVINIHGIKKQNKTFKNLIMLEGISCPGDSGSLVVDKNRNVVGIVIAHDPRAQRTFMHDINDLLAYNGNDIKTRKLPFALDKFY